MAKYIRSIKKMAGGGTRSNETDISNEMGAKKASTP